MTYGGEAGSVQEEIPATGGEEARTEGSDAALLRRLAEVSGLFLRLGFTAFGGPAAHIAMMRAEVVERRRWVSSERFMDLIGITTHIPQFRERKNRFGNKQSQVNGGFSGEGVEVPKPACVLGIRYECATDQCPQNTGKSSAWWDDQWACSLD